MISEVAVKDERSTTRCKVCSNAQSNKTHASREMMLGIRTTFHYSECAACGSVRLIDPPDDFNMYYPRDYYSFEEPQPENGLKNAMVARVRLLRDRTYLGEGGWMGRILTQWYDNPVLRATLRLKLNASTRILDVGCGSGKLLLRLHELGFKSLTGIDPFISKDVRYGANVWIRKGLLEDIKNENWDVIMFHHSLEHVPDPLTTLQAAKGLLSVGGQCLVRLPVVSWAWKHYGPSWVGLDPPRHFWLPTDKGMRILAESVGLEITRVEYDSDGLQFWGSELYSRDHAYAEVCSGESKLRQHFTRKQLAEFRQNAKVLNRKGIGDSAAFFMQRTDMVRGVEQRPQSAEVVGS